jgi:hypothetical protein
MRHRRRAVSVFLGVLAALAVASSALGASPWFSIREQGVGAVSEQVTCDDIGHGRTACDVRVLQVFKGVLKVSGSRLERADEVCYERLTATLSDDGELIDAQTAFGCAIDPHTVRVRGMSRVALRTTDIDLVALTCDEFDCAEAPAGRVSVDGRWSGVGRVFPSHDRFRFDDEGCLEIDALQGRARNANFAGTADGVGIDAELALIGAGTFRLRTTCQYGAPEVNLVH